MTDRGAVTKAIEDFEHRLAMVERWLVDPKTWEFANTPYDGDALGRQREFLTGRLKNLRLQLDDPPEV